MNKQYKFLSDVELYALLSASKREAEDAFTELYNRYSSRIHAYCLRVLENNEHAEDIFQEAFIRFYQSARSQREMTNVPGFLLTIARNLCLNAKRDRRPALNIEEMTYLMTEDKPYEKTELLDLITRSLDLLDFEYREAFVLREYDGFSHEEIAEITGATVTNAKTRIFRAKQKIKAILSPYLKDLHQ